MKLFDIIKTVSSGVIREIVPGGGLIIDAVNEFLPGDKKLPGDATGTDIERAFASMPADLRAQVMGKEFDVQQTQIRESYSTLRSMLESDAKNQHTTRPYIAKHAFHVVAFCCLCSMSVWVVGVLRNDESMVTAVTEGWDFVLAVIGPLVGLLWAYFGILKTEHKNRLFAATGKNPSAIGTLIESFSKKNR